MGFALHAIQCGCKLLQVFERARSNLIAWIAFGISKHDFIDALAAVVVMQFIYAPILAISFALMKKPLALASSVFVAGVIIAIPFIFSFFVLAMCAMKGSNWH